MAASQGNTAELAQEIDRRLAQLADVRDFLVRMERGDGLMDSEGANAMFARVALVEAAAAIEEAAFQAGLLPDRKSGANGWFVNEFPEARHG